MGTYHINLVGESFGNRQRNIWAASEGETVRLRREPDNQYDKNAILVLSRSGQELGYIGKDKAKWIAKIMDEGRPVTAQIDSIVGGTTGKESVGVVLFLHTDDEAEEIETYSDAYSGEKGGVSIFAIIVAVGILIWWFA
jgi:single-stranded-DNA-specific exonuclease